MKQQNNNQTLDVTIQKIVPGGYGLAFAENLTVFVSLAAVGDELRVRVKEKKGKAVFCEIVEILKPSASRAAPGCEYFGICGGCDFQQMSYAVQLEAKVAIVKDCLTRIGKINYESEIEIIGSPQDYGYRSRAQWHLDTRRRKIGYFKRWSHEIIDVEKCPILVPRLQEKLSELQTNLNWGEFWENKVEIETASAGNCVSVYSPEIIEPTSDIMFEANGEKYFYNAEIFFQGNQFLIPQLLETALHGASGARALDLFCGAGLFTLPLARKFEKVFGVEANSKSIEFAKKNIERARLANVEFFDESVGEFLMENETELENLDFVLLDPPRMGAEKQTIEALLRFKPKQISYVSCDPATLSRDLKMLTEEIYSIESITALDLFPQTHHVETVARLQLKD
ncbi:MAG: class I SAM-dependent RNA methyltransferase [Pyrinomonadaceae bacterium]